MRLTKSIVLISILVGAACSDNEPPISKVNLFETNHTLGSVQARYSYENERVERITHRGDNGEHTYVQVNYLNDFDTKISSVNYYPDVSNLHVTDTVIYSVDNLIQIIRTITENGVQASQDTTTFTYDLQNRLIKVSNPGITTVVQFLDYQGSNFTKSLFFRGPELKLAYETFLNYDNKVSPFRDLGYLNLVVFRDNQLQGLELLTANNIIQLVGVDHQPGGVRQIPMFNYNYDSKDRPIRMISTRVSDDEFILEEFYQYSN